MKPDFPIIKKLSEKCNVNVPLNAKKDVRRNFAGF